MKKIKKDYLRMTEWLLLAALFYFVALVLAPQLNVDAGTRNQIATLAWKVGNAVVGVFFGYWADRFALGRVIDESSGMRKLARAVIIAGFIHGITGGV